MAADRARRSSTRLRTRSAAVLVVALSLAAAAAGAALSQERAPAPAPTPVSACRAADFRIVLDVGHTPEAPGAISAHGIPEYLFNLRLAETAREALLKAGFDRTALFLTDKPPPLGLFERAWFANRSGADLYIAVHHDSVPDYLLHDWDYAGQQLRYNDDYPGYAIFVSEANGDRTGSLAFGHLLGKELEARGLAFTPHYTSPLMRHRRRELLDPQAGVYRYDALAVLERTRMPAVLLEAGSIINRTEDLALATPERRDLIGSAIVAAATEFCASRATPQHHRWVRRAALPVAAVHGRLGSR
jgi:N-acetylmuramoyl-L-alanine amidase